MSFQRITTIGSIPVVEQRRDGLADDPVAVVLQPVQLDRVVRDVPEPAQPRHGLRDLARRRVEHPREVLRLRHRRLDLVQPEVVGDLLGEVDHVVERGGQLVDVLAVDRRHEGLVEALDDVVRDPVALLLADQDLARELVALGVLLQQLLEQSDGALDVPARFLEEVEELTIARRRGRSPRRTRRDASSQSTSNRASSMRRAGSSPTRSRTAATDACQSYSTRRRSTRSPSITA